jgi:hypothetical protein
MGLYWNTLRINKKYENVPIWIKRFLRGASVNIITTTRCNLHCEECPMFLYGQPKNYPESTLEQWQTFFRRFPMWISQVYLSGGETSLYPHIVPLANWLIDRGHHVCLFSNLWKPEAFIGIKKHWFFILRSIHAIIGRGSTRHRKCYRNISGCCRGSLTVNIK